MSFGGCSATTEFHYLGDQPALNQVILFNLATYPPARLAYLYASPLCSHGTRTAKC
jgi:ubiquinone biosynthesis protein Coq4